MPSIYQLKPAFQQRLRPFVGRLAARGVTPNQVTLVALALSALVGLLLGSFPQQRWLYPLLPLALLLRMALNAIDGMLAREQHMATPLGAILNELSDPLADAFLYLPFFAITGDGWVYLLVILAVLTELVGVLGQTIGASRRYDGPMGKSDRAFVFGLLALLLAFTPLTPTVLRLIFLALALLLVLTIFNRIRGALGEVAA